VRRAMWIPILLKYPCSHLLRVLNVRRAMWVPILFKYPCSHLLRILNAEERNLLGKFPVVLFLPLLPSLPYGFWLPFSSLRSPPLLSRITHPSCHQER
ncbi:hypothetical protein Taro_028221, partial [Colocasia esculenta]|nr:hypothetical protein [Colocasia esculenta]